MMCGLSSLSHLTELLILESKNLLKLSLQNLERLIVLFFELLGLLLVLRLYET
jgi:uncharacterized protein YhhL (DUF1145 family)